VANGGGGEGRQPPVWEGNGRGLLRCIHGPGECRSHTQQGSVPALRDMRGRTRLVDNRHNRLQGTAGTNGTSA
jgi:hypothetical protein